MPLRLAVWLIGALFSFLPVLGWMVFDHTMSNRAQRAAGGEGTSFGSYAMGWVQLIADAAVPQEDAKPGAGMPSDLLAMLPKAPPGWIGRPAEPGDETAFETSGLDPKLARVVLDALTPDEGNGVKNATMVYRDSGYTVAFQLSRYPDFIFTSFGGMALKMELEMRDDADSSREFMVVRGFEVDELVLPEEAPVRVLRGKISAQLRLQVTASKRVSDADLRSFFETLHVKAMNAAVVTPIRGMGDVPLIVMSGELRAEALAARERERAERIAAEKATRAERQAAWEAEDDAKRAAAEAEAAAKKPGADVKVNRNEKKRKGETALPGTGKTELGSGECRVEGGRKICGIGAQ